MSPTYYLAPAKLNLFLHVTGRRSNGYHTLQTIFQFLDYSDILQFNLRHDGRLTCRSTAKIPPNQDLIFQAAQLLKHTSGTSQGIDIRVKKRIPIGGGLGGGSSDAATTLLALNQLWQLDLPLTTLAQLGLQLGADVPVFVHGQAAWAEGVGEILTPIELEEPWYLVIHPGCQIPTAQIFADPDLTRNASPITLDAFLAGQCHNLCETIVRTRYPQVATALDWLNQYSPARLTGTGACLFARFASSEQAHLVLTKLPKIWKGFVAQGRNKSPALKGFTND